MTNINNTPSKGSPSTGGYNTMGYSQRLHWRTTNTTIQHYPQYLLLRKLPTYTTPARLALKSFMLPRPPVELANQLAPASSGPQILYLSSTGSGPVPHGMVPVSITSSPSFGWPTTGPGVGGQQFQYQPQFTVGSSSRPAVVAAPTPQLYVVSNNAYEQRSDADTRATPAPPYEEHDQGGMYPDTDAKTS
ncbi:hypothetical protein AMATHDRAFT_5048 [Amanita thiersii Skay4041]|uniref:Uncharacterized protein n=1 Tax=Amanita thiersii Skay4041 TaxID=703135 RepID=A0A2A9NIZ7_9AGAR|nr:hypothetical protein AMATHDRAFT_5048 [Amanita thiersii Skay4041]